MPQATDEAELHWYAHMLGISFTSSSLVADLHYL